MFAMISVLPVNVGATPPTTAPTSRPTTLPAAFDRRAVCKVEALFADKGKAAESSAVVIRIGTEVTPKAVLMTVRHGVEGADAVTVTLAGGRQLPAEVKLFDDPPRLKDIALLAVDAQDVPGVTTGTLPAVGDRVWAVGRHAEGKTPRKVTEIATSDTGGRWILTDAEFGPGDSGGALLNDEGELVGLLLGESDRGRAAVTWLPTLREVVEPLRKMFKEAGPSGGPRR